MKTVLFPVLGAVAVFASGVTPSTAGDRYADRPPVMVSPDLSAPWVLQLGHAQRQNHLVALSRRHRHTPDRLLGAVGEGPAIAHISPDQP